MKKLWQKRQFDFRLAADSLQLGKYRLRQLIFAIAYDHLVYFDTMDTKFLDRLLQLKRVSKNLDTRDFSPHHFHAVIENGHDLFGFDFIGLQPFDESG